MKKLSIKLFFLTGILFFVINGHAQINANWTNKQLMEPSELAKIITDKKDSIVIISVGPFKTIPGTISAGMVSEKEGLDKLKAQLSNMDKNKKIVIYCGCCPFEHCPNVRPAIDVLKEMNFTNYYLLDLPHNIKINWIDEGYPVTK
jgi:hypothetical protein